MNAEVDIDLDNDDTDDELTKQFSKASKHLESLLTIKSIDQTLLLKLYGYFKIATVGKCDEPKPRFFYAKAVQKWQAWNNLNHLSSEQAKQQYIDIIKELDPNWSPENKQTIKTGWACVSSLMHDEEIEGREEDKTIFDYVKESNVEKLREKIQTATDLNVLDSDGLGLIHWACDRGDEQILKILLENRIDVNLQATDGQTGLHYAASCGHLECVKLLLKYNADKTIKDEDGLFASEVAEDKDVVEILS